MNSFRSPRSHFRTTRLTAHIALLAGLTLGASGADWPQWRGPQRTGISSEKGFTTTFPVDGPKVLWTANVGKGFSAVSVAGGKAYTLGNDGKEDTIYGLDAVTGRELWKHSYPHPLDAKYYQGGSSGTPTVDGNRVYVLSRRGHLHCLDAATGAVVWQKNVATELGAKIPEWGFASSVLIDGNRAVVNVGTYGAALDKATGQVIWKTGTGEPGYATPVPFEQNGHKLYLVFAAKELVAVKADSGQVVWSQKWVTSYDVNAADPIVVSPSRVFIATGYNRGGALLDVSGAEPKVIWENKNLRTQLNAAVLIADHLYAIDGDTGKGQLRCVELATGTAKWAFPETKHGALTAADGYLIVIGEKGELLVGEASPVEFKPVARAQIGGGTYWTAPVLANGRLYVRNGEGQVTCLDLGAAQVASVR